MPRNKIRRWYVKFRGNFDALGPFGAPSRAGAREYVLDWLKTDRLPVGTEIWEAGPLPDPCPDWARGL